MTFDNRISAAIGMSCAAVVGTTMEQQLTALRAETLAMRAVLTNVLFQLKRPDPVLADAIARSFDNAADQIERALADRLHRSLALKRS
jgi:hypothetical protein